MVWRVNYFLFKFVYQNFIRILNFYIVKKFLFLFFSFSFLVYSQQTEYLLNESTNGQTINTCLGVFYDSGGANSFYGNNENYTITFCPSSPDEVVTISFASFNVQGSVVNCQDYLEYWFAPSPGEEGSGTQLCGNLGAFDLTSTSADGCISFRFVSDFVITRSGWTGVISCSPAPACEQPTAITVDNITPNTADISWSISNPDILTWQLVVLPATEPFPNTNTPFTIIIVTGSEYNIFNLSPSTAYCAYLRSICPNDEGFSDWASHCFSTSLTPLGCGGIFTDSGGSTGNYSNNENYTTTICPDTPNSFVQATFTQFQTEINWDRLYIFDGPDTDAPLIASTNGPGNGECNTLAGGWWGNQLAGQVIFATNPSGCLTFRFCSDFSVTGEGWMAIIECISAENSHIITVQPFLDSNNNGVKDVDEPLFSFGELNFEVNNDDIIQTAYSPNGFFSFVINDFSEPTIYDFNYNIFEGYQPYFNLTSPVNQNVSVNAVGLTEIFYPIVQTNPYEDLRINLIPLNAPRAGFVYQLKLIYSNDGPSTVNNGTVTFTKDSVLTFTNISDTNAIQSSNGFTLNFTNLLPFENRIIYISLQVPNLPIVSINQLITTEANIVPIEFDVTPDNNSSRLLQGVIAAYDPNDKTEAHGRQIIFEEFDVTTDELTYTIRFENEGNAEAFDVRITDTLDAQIDETSIRMIDASHDYVLTRIDNELEWFFEDINLPPSVPNTLIGHGHVTFKAKLKPGIQVGSIVPNYASIYFDTNPPIVTDVFETEFVEPLSINEFSSQFSIYPNPTNGLINIQSKKDFNAWQIIDLQGKVISSAQTEAVKSLEINVSTIKSGVYILVLSSDEQEAKFKLIKK